ncbi:24270_t:CDS:2 [Gigaspora rosea]|nr:24270_t:CDS:2 [Gigaspora rosea]
MQIVPKFFGYTLGFGPPPSVRMLSGSSGQGPGPVELAKDEFKNRSQQVSFLEKRELLADYPARSNLELLKKMRLFYLKLHDHLDPVANKLQLQRQINYMSSTAV